MRKRTPILAGVLVLFLVCVSAMAQDGHTAPKLEGAFPWRAIGATAICFAGVLLVGLKNSRRLQQRGN
jgi:hypothetical protein